MRLHIMVLLIKVEEEGGEDDLKIRWCTSLYFSILRSLKF